MSGWRALRSLRTWASGSLLAPSSPLPLALLRVAVCLIILVSPEPERAQALAEGPPALWLAPPGVRWFLPLFAAAAPHMVLVRRLLEASAVLGLLGLWTRLSLAVLAVAFVLTFGGAQLNGAVVHDMHLLWFVLLLLVTPSAQTFSLDAWARRAPLLGGIHSTASALGTRACRLLLGLVYFFPGLHKLLAGGLDWASSANLQHQLWLKWFQAGGRVPWPRVDLWPGVLQFGGIAVLVFELGFVAFACSRRAWPRALAAGAGLSFHAVTQYFLYIPFPSLWACYVVLLGSPKPPPASSGEGAPLEQPVSSVPLAAVRLAAVQRAAVWLVSVSLVLAVSVQGARGQTQAWPFACYPTFAARAPETIADLAIDVTSDAGQQRTLRIGPLPPLGGRPPRAWSRVWELGGAYGNGISAPRLEAFAAELERRESDWAQRPTVARFYVEAYATSPEAYGQPPLSRRWIHELRR